MSTYVKIIAFIGNTFLKCCLKFKLSWGKTIFIMGIVINNFYVTFIKPFRTKIQKLTSHAFKNCWTTNKKSNRKSVIKNWRWLTRVCFLSWKLLALSGIILIMTILGFNLDKCCELIFSNIYIRLCYGITAISLFLTIRFC